MLLNVDLHIEGLVVTSLVRLGQEFLVDLGGGYGAWWSHGRLETELIVSTFQCTFGFGSLPADAVNGIEHTLCRWRAAQSFLEAISLPTRLLLTDGTTTLLLPRAWQTR